MAKDAVTVCPECGAKIPKAGMSLCPYCASPLRKSPGKDQDRTPIVERLQKLEEKPEFAAAMEETPPWSPEYARARNHQSQGTVLLVIGLFMAALKFVLAEGGLATGFLIGGATLAVIGLVTAALGLSKRHRLDKLEIIKRSAFLIQRRSTTSIGRTGSVIYYFTIQFGDGHEDEFEYYGRGVNEELYTNGTTGVAFTRGHALLYIARVRA